MYLECAVNIINATRFSWDRVKNFSLQTPKSILINEKQDRNFRQTQYLLQIWGRNVQSIKEQTSAGRCTQASRFPTPTPRIRRGSSSKSRWTQILHIVFIKAVELSHKHVNRQTFCLLQRKLYRKFGTKSWQRWLAWAGYDIMIPRPYPCTNSVQQLHSQHDILQRPSSEKPCVQYKSPHSCFIEKINVVSSQQSLYVISRREMLCNITAWVMSYYCMMSDVILLINTEKEMQCFQIEFEHLHKTYRTNSDTIQISNDRKTYLQNDNI